MILIHRTTYSNSVQKTVGFLLLSYLCIWMLVMNNFLRPTSLSFLLGVLALPFTFIKDGTGAIRYRYLVVSLVWLAASLLVPVKTLLYFGVAFALFFVVETWLGKLSLLSCAVVVLMSPVFQYAANVFSFPVRLQLTRWAGGLFALIHKDVTTAGNMIHYENGEFSVDPACMGLNMLAASLLLGIMLMGYYQKKGMRQVQWWWTLGYLSLVVMLNVFSNLVRILILVQFTILPGAPMHDIAGLLCLGLYVMVPAAFMAKLVVKKYGRPVSPVPLSVTGTERKRATIIHLLLLLAISISSYRVATADRYNWYGLPAKEVKGYASSMYAPGILKLENGKSLIYVKFVRGFYDTDHHPTLCWKGNGYEFRQVKNMHIQHYGLYTAELVNGKEKLYTAWWYGNGKQNTTGQFSWRWDMIKGGKNYAVINVTAATKEDLYKEVRKILNGHSLSVLFDHL